MPNRRQGRSPGLPLPLFDVHEEDGVRGEVGVGHLDARLGRRIVLLIPLHQRLPLVTTYFCFFLKSEKGERERARAKITRKVGETRR